MQFSEMVSGKIGCHNRLLGVLEWIPNETKSKLKHILGSEFDVFERNFKAQTHKCQICSKIIKYYLWG
jgi:hypothetical protein